MNQHLSGHLSEQQIDDWLVGLHPADVEDHLRSCPACTDEVARIAELLALLRGAVRNWSEEQERPVRTTWRTAASLGWGLRIGLALATLWFMILVPVYRHRQATQQAAQQPARMTVDAAAQDELLLRQVQREIAQSVPAPMEPLAKLMPNDLTR